jgi:hypothetical protein
MVVFITTLLYFVNSALFQKQHKLFWKVGIFLSRGERVRRHVLILVWQKETLPIAGQPIMSSDWLWFFYQIQIHTCITTISSEDINISSFQNDVRLQNRVILHVTYNQNPMEVKQFHEILSFMEVTTVFQHMTPCSLVQAYWYCRGSYYFHYQHWWWCQ